MRSRLAPLLLLACLGGCATAADGDVASQPATYQAPVADAWMLVTPPDDVVVGHLRKAVETLPNHGDRLAASRSRNVSPSELRDMDVLFREVAAQPSARAQALYLVERSVRRDAPLDGWNRVREFDSFERCQEIRSELQEITGQASREIAFYPGMPMWQLQWAFLEWSNRWAQCVPMESLASTTG